MRVNDSWEDCVCKNGRNLLIFQTVDNNCIFLSKDNYNDKTLIQQMYIINKNLKY